MATNDPNDLAQRMARCEAMLAVLMMFDGGGLDEISYDAFRRLFQNRNPNDDFLHFLEHFAHFGGQPQRIKEILDKLYQHEQELRRLDKYSARIKSEISEALSLSRRMSPEIMYPPNLNREDIVKVENAQKILQEDVHSYLIAQSLGLDLTDIPLPRFIPVRVYLSDMDDKTVDEVTRSINQILNAIGFSIADDFPAERGSWWKKWFVKSRDAATQPQVTDRLEKLERVLELKGLHQPQANIDKTEAEAAAMLIKAIENIPQVAMQVGSLLLLKVLGDDGVSCLQIRTLSQAEMMCLERNQQILTSPKDVLTNLSELSNNVKIESNALAIDVS